MKGITTNADSLDWQPARAYPEGTEEKVLSAGDKSVPRSVLLKLPPGWNMKAHSHVFTELHYILEGEYTSRDETYPKGTLRVIPQGVEHGPFTTAIGAVILVTWCKGYE